MTPVLRPYQRTLVQDVRTAWSQGARNVLAVLPTGGGKTVCVADIIEQHEGASCLIAHRSELVSQASLMLARYGVRHDIIGASDTKRAIAALHVAELGRCYFSPGSRAVVASVDTLTRRTDIDHWARQVTLWVVDEAHHLTTGGNDPITGIKMGNKWHKAVSRFVNPNVRGLGPTATPMRADGRGLGIQSDGLMHVLVEGPSMRALIEDGYLTDYKVYCPESDLRTLIEHQTVGASGDWSPVQQRAASRESKIVGDVVKSYRTHADGKLALTFTTDVETAVAMAGKYATAGIPAVAITGETDPHIRRQAFRRFVNREIRVVVTVDIVGEGTDIPACEAIIEGRPTQSLAVSMQHWGRGFRPIWADGSEPTTREARLASIAASCKPHAILIDHTGSFIDPSLGPPDRPRVWSLDRRDKKSTGPSDAIPLRVCLSCYQPYERIRTACPYCGEPVPAPTSRSAPEHVDGDLAELSPEVLARLRGDVAAVDRTPDEVRAHYAATGLPDLMVRAQVNRHRERTQAQAALRQAMGLWGGTYHQRGECDRTLQKRFFITYGISTVEAVALGARDADALHRKIAGGTAPPLGGHDDPVSLSQRIDGTVRTDYVTENHGGG